MPLDKILISHLDEQDILEDSIDEEIESLVGKLKISDLMNGSEDALLNIVDMLQEILKEKYYPTASENGLNLASDIEKDGDIQVPKSNDPNLNEELLDGIQGES